LNNELKNHVEEVTMTRGIKRKIEKYIVDILKINIKLTKNELFLIINERYKLKNPVPETTLQDKLAELVKQKTIIEQIEKIGNRPQKFYSLGIAELAKTPRHFMLSRSIGMHGIRCLKNRETAKEKFDQYLPIITQLFACNVLLTITEKAFSSNGKDVMDRINKNDNYRSLIEYIENDLIIPMLQKDSYSLRFLSYLIVELFSNADVVFGEYVFDPKSSIRQHMEKLYGDDNAIWVNNSHLKCEILEILAQQNKADNNVVKNDLSSNDFMPIQNISSKKTLLIKDNCDAEEEAKMFLEKMKMELHFFSSGSSFCLEKM